MKYSFFGPDEICFRLVSCRALGRRVEYVNLTSWARMSWNRKHLLDIESLNVDEINTVLDTARAFKAVGERAIKKVPALRGKTVVNLFVEPSTRTRISFELSEQRLSADIINFTAEASSLKRRNAQGYRSQP